MAAVNIENPILNSPFEEPNRHFKFDDDGITEEIISNRRPSAYFLPIPQQKKKGKQKYFDTDWTNDRKVESKFINDVRERVRLWREGHYPSITPTSRRLLEYWTDPDRDKPLFFCQIEALETVIYLTEAAARCGDGWIATELKSFNDAHNPLLDRIAFKMATGSGKTVVMAMLIAWHTLNKVADRQNPRFADAFLLVAPGITIRDRLRVLLPGDPNSYYRQRDIVPSWQMDELQKAKIIISNYHAFLLREKESAASLTKKLLAQGGPSPFTETPPEMVRRVLRELGTKKNIVVINDEAHHCYRGKLADTADDDADSETAEASTDEKLTGDDRKEAAKRNAEARVWISGLEAIKEKIGIRSVYDLSATPFFLKGSGFGEGKLFPWVVSDFSLIDAIEAGIVKIPRVPVADDSGSSEVLAYRDIWHAIREELPKKGRKTDAKTGQPHLPAKLQGALLSLYQNYQKSYEKWEQNAEARARGMTPPVFIVVCNNTSVSKMVFDYIAGWEKQLPDGEKVVVPGALSIFSNEQDGQWTHRPNTILIDSEQLESGESLSAEFKALAGAEIEEFKAEYRARFPGRDADKVTDEELLREVMNTVGKAGKLGENIKCVVSVSMLTEGWDANTVTHILGVRAFGTQLLCEQVVGRGLRRVNYEPNPEGKFEPEYAEVYGVPFSFIASTGSSNPKPTPQPTRVRALPERKECAISFPRLLGYRYDIAEAELKYKFVKDCRLPLSTADIPTKTENAPIVGQSVIHTLDDLKKRREREVAFLLAKLTLEKYFRADNEKQTDRPAAHTWNNEVQAWRFPQLLQIAQEWLDQCVQCKDNAFKQLLLLIEFAHDAADKIYLAIVNGDNSDAGRKILLPIMQPYDPLGSTHHVDFTTIRPTMPTDPAKCHISHVVADTKTWEQKVADVLEELPEVIHYAKNQGLGFFIPYTINGVDRRYFPDFLVRIDDGNGPADLLNLVLECSGEAKKEKAVKVATARNLWIPAVNNAGEFGRWEFLETNDPWNLKTILRQFLRESKELATA
jgi:type III restriction enzyme